MTGRTVAAGRYLQTVCKTQQQDSVLAVGIQTVGKQISRSRVGRQGANAAPYLRVVALRRIEALPVFRCLTSMGER